MIVPLRTSLLALPRRLGPPRFQTLVRCRSTHAELTRQLLPVNDGVPEDAQRELRWIEEEIQRVADLKGDLTVPEQESRLEAMVRERAEGKPLQYVLGNQPFGPLLLTVRPPVLIPRPETEEWTLHLASLLQPSSSFPSSPSTPPSTPPEPLRILDLCTGTGCIPLLLLSLLPLSSAKATAIDVLPAACSLATENARIVLLEGRELEVLERDIFAEGFLEEMLEKKRNPDVLTSNPPYIPEKEMRELDRSVSGWESHLALAGDVPESFDGSTIPSTLSHLRPLRGLDFYHHISHLIARGLVRSPSLPTSYPQIVLEVGHDQAREVRGILLANPRVERTDVWVDFAGKERVVAGWLRCEEA